MSAWLKRPQSTEHPHVRRSAGDVLQRHCGPIENAGLAFYLVVKIT